MKLNLIKKNAFFILLFLLQNINAQEGFRFINAKKKVETIRFQEVNNLIIIPLNVNGRQLSFILDTGVNKTILFNLSPEDSTKLKNSRKVTLQGLGGGDAIDALLSKQNSIGLQNYKSTNEEVFVILDDKFDVSSRMGITINGIIGYNILKNAIVYINYKSREISFYNPALFNYKKCRRCEVFPLEFYRNKPYIDVQVQLDTVNDVKTDVKMLIDTGGSEAIWLFENSKEVIQTPKRNFRDILGEGLSGTVYGNKSRIKELSIGRFNIKNPTASFLDSASTFNARTFKDRNGSIGGNIFKRFKLWIDYPNSKITFKKNGSFRGGFEYNMSGIDVVYNGKTLVKVEDTKRIVDQYNTEMEARNTVTAITTYKYAFKQSYRINKIVEGSPAALAGLLSGDILLEINGTKVHNYSLKQLLGLLQERDGKRIRLKVERNLTELKFEFKLKKRI